MSNATIAVVAVLATLASTAFAGGGHTHGGEIKFGSPGKESEVTRTIEVVASDTMRFTPGSFRIKRGEVIKFVVKNAGKTRHEFSIGDRAAQRAHAAMMKSMPDMRHEDDPASITLEPGQTKTLVWKFDQQPAGSIEIACHIPGHYEAGMKARVTLVP